MPLTHIKLTEFITLEERLELLHIAHNTRDWIVHKSSKSGKISSLHFIRINKKFFNRDCLLMMMKPNTTQDWHSDMPGRDTVCIYPLTENYAPCEMEGNITIDTPALVNTQMRHRVVNNDQIRINLQIPFNESIEEVITNYDFTR
jgi:hypothetical protein